MTHSLNLYLKRGLKFSEHLELGFKGGACVPDHEMGGACVPDHTVGGACVPE